MKSLFRWLFRLFLLAIVLVVAVILVKDTVLKALTERRIRQQTGMDVRIEKLDVGLLAPTFSMRGFKLYNPPGFGGSVLLDIPEVDFEYDAREAASGKLHLRLLRFHLRELNLIRDQQGRTNIFGVVNAPSAGSKGGTGPGKFNLAELTGFT